MRIAPASRRPPTYHVARDSAGYGAREELRRGAGATPAAAACPSRCRRRRTSGAVYGRAGAHHHLPPDLRPPRDRRARDVPRRCGPRSGDVGVGFAPLLRAGPAGLLRRRGRGATPPAASERQMTAAAPDRSAADLDRCVLPQPEMRSPVTLPRAARRSAERAHARTCGKCRAGVGATAALGSLSTPRSPPSWPRPSGRASGVGTGGQT